jgi:hypothetical protein
MIWAKAMLSELIGLFVDDGSLALAVLAWVTINWWLLGKLDLPRAWDGAVLFAGLALILLENALRGARVRPT